MTFGHLAFHAAGEQVRVPRPVAEALSWRVAAELVRRHPDELCVIETHPMTGQYDCLTILDRNRTHQGHPVVQMNRMPGGHVTPRSWFSTNAERANWLDVLFAEHMRREIVIPLEHMEGLSVPTETPPTMPTSIGARVIAAALWTRLATSPLTAHNGVLDSSGMFGSGIRTGLFSAFAGLASEIAGHDPDELVGHPAYDYWFLTGTVDGAADQPIIGIDTRRGLAWSKRLQRADLMSLYDQCDRKINLLVAKLALG